MKVLVFVLASLVAVGGCDSPGGPNDEDDLDYDRLLQALRQSGLSAQPAGQVSQPFFSVPSRLIAIDADQVQVLEYPDERSAQADAARVSPDGSTVGNSRRLGGTSALLPDGSPAGPVRRQPNGHQDSP